MKRRFLSFMVCAGFVLHGCGESLVDPRYTVRMPELPPAWESLLGAPHWRVEWLDGEGRKKAATVRGGAAGATGATALEISLPPTWASAVSAAPFWPDRGLGPGIFKPAGAIFPFDVSGKSLVLSWQGGVDATLYWELAEACSHAAYGEAGQESVRLPWNFDWPRFRLLFEDPTVNAKVRADPWLADWNSIAAKTIKSGFDKRRLVPEARGSLTIPVSPGPWIGASPFAEPLLFEATPVFPVREISDTWVSAEGILRCNSKTWILLP